MALWWLCISCMAETKSLTYKLTLGSRSIALKTLGILTMAFYTAGPNLVILAWTLGETTQWLHLQPSSSWLWRRKHSKRFSLCTTRITRTILLGCIWILHFHFKIVLVVPKPCNNGKRKYGLDDGCTNLIFSNDDGFTRWWRWLNQFLRVIFDTHSRSPANMHIGCVIVAKCDTFEIFDAYALLDCITTGIVGNVGNRYNMQVTHSQKERIFHP